VSLLIRTQRGDEKMLTEDSHMYGSRNLENAEKEIQKGIKLSQYLAAALEVSIDTENQQFVEKVETWE